MENMEKREMSRRELIKWTGLGAAAAAVTGVAKRAEAAAAAVGDKRYAMVIDLRRCYGCHACSVACKSEFDVPLGRWRSWVKTVERGTYPNARKHFLPRLCNHCKKPPCVNVCPTSASHIRPDGIVDIHEDLCIGCKNCIAMCPYNSRFTDPVRKIARKCDFCIHRITKGIAPSCVNTCPARARIFGDLNDPSTQVAKLVKRLPVLTLKTELGTHPHVFYIAADESTTRAMGGGE
ncbi:MAG: 4Fe-4S dicluster domain-containing protein [Desulfobacteraceae bacterium]